MKLIAVLGLLLFASIVHAQDLERTLDASKTDDLNVPLTNNTDAQDLKRRPDAPKTNDLNVRLAGTTLVKDWIYPNTPIPDGMVWVPRGKVWRAEELNSCTWCGKPMTFKQAAFDKKMTSMWLLELGLTITDVELGQSCMRAGRCKEGNPFLGTGSRSTQYGIRLPGIIAGWMDSAWARKGDKSFHIGGLKRWYVLPLVMHAESAIGIISGLCRQ